MVKVLRAFDSIHPSRTSMVHFNKHFALTTYSRKNISLKIAPLFLAVTQEIFLSLEQVLLQSHLLSGQGFPLEAELLAVLTRNGYFTEI